MTSKLLLAGGLTIALAGCGVTYKSPSIGAAATDASVRVVELTPQTVLVANRAPYRPRTLPAVFGQSAGAGGAVRGAGELPDLPLIPDARPEALELRAPPAVQPPPYRIGVGDVLLISTTSTASTIQELSGLLRAQGQRQGFTVRDDGAIAVPDVGTIMMAGMTLEEAEARLFEALVAAQIDPAFSLEVAEFNSKRVTIGGAVGNPSLVPVTLNPMTLREALIAAGDLRTRNAEFASIRIYRDGELYQIPVEDYRRRADLQNLTLLNGDAVFVDTTYDLEQAMEFYESQIEVIMLRRNARQQALSELESEISLRRSELSEQRENFRIQSEFDAVERDYVYLSGEVAKQSRFTMPFGRDVTLADVLYGSGGFDTTTGNPAEIYVLRASDDPAEFGAVTAWHLDAENAINLTLATRMTMRPNDIVFIEEQPITKWNRAFQQVFPVLFSVAAAAN
ncbi:MAG: sugar transporter [Rhodobacteraceae bacterium]|nr:MAG: sugar transporter [Paracoccaceae bacterium]